MLQPRIPFQRLCTQCRSVTLIARRTYAQAIDTIKPNQTTEENTTDTTAITKDSSSASNKVGLVNAALALRRYTPRTPGVRHLVRPINDHLWKGRPLYKLTTPKKGQAKGGRNHTGHIVVRHRGGGHKRRLRLVDFDRAAPGKHLVERIEHDPGRTAHIALVRNMKTGEQSYILAAEGIRAGDTVESFRAGLTKELLRSMGGSTDQGVVASKTAFKGNCLKLSMVPVGTSIFAIAAEKGGKATLCRSAGTYGIVIGKGEDTVQKEMVKLIGDTGSLSMETLSDDQKRRFQQAANYVTVKLSSGEIRLIDKEATATIGVASNPNYKYTSLGKAGRKRWLGIRPTVRGLAMNANEHPHGGGRGKSKGNVDPVSPWGQPAKSGFKTRPKHKVNKLVVQERPRNQGKRRKN